MRRSLAPRKSVQRFGFSLASICLLELLVASSIVEEGVGNWTSSKQHIITKGCPEWRRGVNRSQR